MGQSMGGLIARYALKTMENDGEKHEVSTYISHDSPHLGVNVPVGAFYFVNQLFSLSNGYSNAVWIYDLFAKNDLSDMEATVYNVMNSAAARQMMCNYISTFNGGIDNSVHRNWIYELEGLGFPEGDEGEDFQNLSIVNGGTYDLTSSLVNGQYLFYLDGYLKSSIFTDILAPLVSAEFALAMIPLLFITGLEKLIPASFLPGSSRFDIHAEVWPALSDRTGHEISVLRVKYTKTYFWCSPKEYMLFSSTLNSPVLSMYYDELPGSTYSLMDTKFADSDIADSGILGSYDYPLQFTDKITFVPTASALAMRGDLTLTDYTRDYHSDPPVPEMETPFDAYYLSSSSSTHISINNTIFQWIADCLNGEISGPDHVTEEAKYSVTGYTGAVSWSSSDESIAAIDASGKLTPTGNGVVEIEAKSYSFGKLFRKTKKVLIGFPDIAITRGFSPGEGYSFIVRCTDSATNQMMNQLVSDGVMSYEWTIIDSEGERTTSVSSSDSFYYMPEVDGAITIAVRFVGSDGHKGTTYADSFNLKVPFEFNYKYITIDQNKNVHFVRFDNTYESFPSQDFTMVLIASELDKFFIFNDEATYYISSRKSSNLKVYLKGARDSGLSHKWTFNLFDSLILFIEPLKDVLSESGAGGFEHRIYDFEFILYNSEKEELMKIPFVAIGKVAPPQINI